MNFFRQLFESESARAERLLKEAEAEEQQQIARKALEKRQVTAARFAEVSAKKRQAEEEEQQAIARKSLAKWQAKGARRAEEMDKKRQAAREDQQLTAHKSKASTIDTHETRTAIKRIVVFKAGARPSNESWYLQQVCESIGLSVGSLEGINLDIRYLPSSSINQSYIVGFALESGYDVSRCSLTPFEDRDGGSGMVLKVMN